MKLIGMLDSPYVRRVAISLQLLGLRFEHSPLSVFSTFAEFRQINPVVKAPSLICDDGEVLMDSSLILEYAEPLAHPRTLMPGDRKALQHDLRLIGLGLAAMEKAVQLVYENGLRPAEKRHEPWIERVTGQLHSAFGELENELGRNGLSAVGSPIRQAGVTIGVAWHFTRQMLPEVVSATAYPRLDRFSAEAESLPEFRAAPHGAGTYRG
ncbi:MAG: glutathione S-transferase [Burkholderiaceae bacterium]